ncbi:MAG: hypothetical protein UT63_C0003G0042 [Candidatus Gottesmanbacteria bacterium GW2011_GWC2_39_8]|uniref:Uncharacterized protein n=1 Tax=Candidatus Gottesmanbacteria bacterium GW2011_GWC2_39_8 TaxID=1618450 RepID=A0A0G0QAG1_9BACT|nr:MAG: hypothetical protein UT63_C0003G0042 [Candidatus Gottesmanbacteria bacterium GW2011_GWC2_39_8]
MIKEEIQKNILVSLKAKNTTELSVLRFVLSLIKYEEIAKQKELTDEEIVKLIQKEIKKRQEAIEMFKKVGKTEGVEEEEKQIDVIKKYIPEEMTDEELEKIVDQAVAEAGSVTNPGPLIGKIMSLTKGKVSGDRVSAMVRKKLI